MYSQRRWDARTNATDTASVAARTADSEYTFLCFLTETYIRKGKE